MSTTDVGPDTGRPGTERPGRAVTATYAPPPRGLADTELLLGGAYAPLTGFLGAADAAAVAATGRLADGTPWPAPVTLDLGPAVEVEGAAAGGLADLAAGGVLAVEDPEGTPVAYVDVTEVWSDAAGRHVAGPVRAGRPAAAGSFRALHRSPAEVRTELAGRAALAVLVDRPLHADAQAAVALTADAAGAVPLLLVPTVGDRAYPAESLVRLALAARAGLPGAVVVAVPLARRADGSGDAAGDAAGHGSGDAPADVALTARVAAAYGATALLTAAPLDPGTAGLAVLAPPPVVHDTRTGQWAPAGDVPAEAARSAPDAVQVERWLDAGHPLPDWFSPPAVAAELAHARPPRSRRGLTVLFTGLSGSGKSTVARALYDALAERADRTVTLLDGDVVRRMLSAGLGFSRADRDRNVLRIGFVAAEVARHGGLAICAPIAPYAATRAEVRRMVTAAGGGFVLVHVATPLAECERRDRKGLYAKARAGLIPEFTGISDPYEAPEDADLVLDTTGQPVGESVRAVLDHLTAEGWLEETS